MLNISTLNNANFQPDYCLLSPYYRPGTVLEARNTTIRCNVLYSSVLTVCSRYTIYKASYLHTEARIRALLIENAVKFRVLFVFQIKTLKKCIS